LPSASSLLASIMSLPIMSWYVIVLFPLLLLSAPAPYLVFSMIAHCLLCGLAHFVTTVTPRTYGMLFAFVLCVTVPKGSVHDARLLVKG
jgi:hypothetical protein